VASLVRLDPAAGFAFIGSDRVPLSDWGRDGALQIGGERGPLLRAPRFGQRSRVAWRALASTDPRTALARGMLHAALERDGDADPLILEIIALALAGADNTGGSFTETALLVARASGTDIGALDGLDAVEVDRLAVHLTPAASNEWQTFVLGELEAASATGTRTIRDTLADRLLRRADPTRVEEGVATRVHSAAPERTQTAETAHASLPETPTALRSRADPSVAERSDHREPAPTPATAHVRAVADRAPAFDALHVGDMEHQDVPVPARPAASDNVLARAVSLAAHGLGTRSQAPASAAIASMTVRPSPLDNGSGWRVDRSRRTVPGSAAVSPVATFSPTTAASVAAGPSPPMPTPGPASAFAPATSIDAVTAVSARSPESHFTSVDAGAGVRLRERAKLERAAVDFDEVADELAQRLDDEAALRGVFR
jgi:hypothetical protein